MSTSLLYHAYGLKGYKHKRTFFEGDRVIFEIVWEKTIRCPLCRSKRVIKHGAQLREWLAPPTGGKRVMLRFAIPRVECLDCGCRRQIELDFAEARRSFTKSFERYVLDLSRHMTILDVARFFHPRRYRRMR